MHHVLINPSGFVRVSELRSLGVPFAVSTIWQKVSRGDFPTPVKLGPAVTAWKIADVLAWLDAQAENPQPAAGNQGARLTAARMGKRRQDAARIEGGKS